MLWKRHFCIDHGHQPGIGKSTPCSSLQGDCGETFVVMAIDAAKHYSQHFSGRYLKAPQGIPGFVGIRCHGSSEGHEMLKRNDKNHSIADDVPIPEM